MCNIYLAPPLWRVLDPYFRTVWLWLRWFLRISIIIAILNSALHFVLNFFSLDIKICTSKSLSNFWDSYQTVYPFCLFIIDSNMNLQDCWWQSQTISLGWKYKSGEKIWELKQVSGIMQVKLSQKWYFLFEEWYFDRFRGWPWTYTNETANIKMPRK